MATDRLLRKRICTEVGRTEAGWAGCGVPSIPAGNTLAVID